MTRTDYENRRKTLMDEAQTLLDESKLDDFKAKTAEVEALDSQYEAEAKEQANLNALSNKKVGGVEKMAVDVGGTIVDSVNVAVSDIYDSDEYKRAFMNYVTKGIAIPAKFMNVDANTKTSDVGAVIPTTTIQKIYEAMERLGMVLPLVTKTSYAGGVTVPTSSVKPVATWVAEGAGSDKQKKAVGSITFAYHKLRCAVSMSYEVANMAYPFFEAQFTQNVADAMVKAKETAIIKGSGSGQPKGILKETAAANVDITEGNHITYATLVAAEGAEEDDAAVWCMTKKTFYSEIVGMVDDNKQPIARVNMGTDGKPEYAILGRRVVIVNPNYMDTFATSVTADSIVAFMYNFSDYIFNSGVGMTVKQYEDNDTDDTIIKAIEVCDGKSVRNTSLVTVTVKNS